MQDEAAMTYNRAQTPITPSPTLEGVNFDDDIEKIAASSDEEEPRPPPPPHDGDAKRPRVVNYQDLPYMGEMTLDNSKPRRGRKPKKADICHLIYKNYGTIFPGTPNPAAYLETKPEAEPGRTAVQNRIISSLLERRLTQDGARRRPRQNEPLNLCVRDLNQLKIRLLKRHDNTYTSTAPATITSEVKAEPASDEEVEFVGESAEKGPGPNGFVYWPNAGVFLHPMALQQQLLYYQRMSQLEQDKGLIDKKVQELGRKIVPKLVPPKKPVEIRQTPSPQPDPAKSKRCHATGNKTPTKRKRSAIFIPPIAAESTNPATEVSICKFKFTGGAKPSLQEKKMLSVDSGGNFRYYSGTGDKSMRGYEFFPRETLQQQVNSTQGSSTGAFLSASGEKMHPLEFGPTAAPPADLAAAAPDPRKRKSRKSLQREKLEQTFKEKGFLIQTQQLESAEGATYCKFRQLRKFTRYLFRSWKDYLPGNVRELQEGEKLEEGEAEGEVDSLSRHSSEVSSQNGA